MPVGWKERAVGFRETLGAGVSCWIAPGAMVMVMVVVVMVCHFQYCCFVQAWGEVALVRDVNERGTGREGGFILCFWTRLVP